MSKHRERAAIAHHEAGHYVVGRAVGRTLYQVSIIATADTEGHASGDEDLFNAATLDADRTMACIVELLAGAAAQRAFGDDEGAIRSTARIDDEKVAALV